MRRGDCGTCFPLGVVLKVLLFLHLSNLVLSMYSSVLLLLLLLLDVWWCLYVVLQDVILQDVVLQDVLLQVEVMQDGG